VLNLTLRPKPASSENFTPKSLRRRRKDAAHLAATAASNVAYDIVKNVVKPLLPDRAIIWISRAVVVVIGVGSWLIALGPQELLAWFIWAALSIMVNCFFWPLIGGLYWRRMNKHAARWGMIAGFAVTLATFAMCGTTVWIDGIPFYAVLPGFIASTATTIILALLTRPHSEELLRETLTGAFLKLRGSDGARYLSSPPLPPSLPCLRLPPLSSATRFIAFPLRASL